MFEEINKLCNGKCSKLKNTLQGNLLCNENTLKGKYYEENIHYPSWEVRLETQFPCAFVSILSWRH